LLDAPVVSVAGGNVSVKSAVTSTASVEVVVLLRSRDRGGVISQIIPSGRASVSLRRVARGRYTAELLVRPKGLAGFSPISSRARSFQVR
jgi:hypothetical protein